MNHSNPHRTIYEQCFGPIPEDMDVHHVDWNHFNNDPDNLSCVTEEMHRWIHTQTTNPWMSKINWDVFSRELMSGTKD